MSENKKMTPCDIQQKGTRSQDQARGGCYPDKPGQRLFLECCTDTQNKGSTDTGKAFITFLHGKVVVLGLIG